MRKNGGILEFGGTPLLVGKAGIVVALLLHFICVLPPQLLHLPRVVPPQTLKPHLRLPGTAHQHPSPRNLHGFENSCKYRKCTNDEAVEVLWKRKSQRREKRPEERTDKEVAEDPSSHRDHSSSASLNPNGKIGITYNGKEGQVTVADNDGDVEVGMAAIRRTILGKAEGDLGEKNPVVLCTSLEHKGHGKRGKTQKI